VEFYANRSAGKGIWIVMQDIILILCGIAVVALLIRLETYKNIIPASPNNPNTINQLIEEQPSPNDQTEKWLSSFNATPDSSTDIAESSPTPGVTPLVPSANTTTSETSVQSTIAFPTVDTGENADYSFQSDALRIAINRIQNNGITYFIADVWLIDTKDFLSAFAKNEYGLGIHQMPIDIAKANNAIFAVTGDYYGARTTGVVIRNGQLYRNTELQDVCVLYANGEMKTYSNDEFDIQTAVDDKAYQAWSFGPTLLDNGQAKSTFDSTVQRKNPRCAIGYYEPGHYCLVVVDGRQEGYSSGMSLEELSQLFFDLGCKEAYNLDGGATAAMIFQGKVISQPCDGGRQSSDIIYFGGEK